jgi:hypothetical protein
VGKNDREICGRYSPFRAVDCFVADFVQQLGISLTQASRQWKAVKLAPVWRT